MPKERIQETHQKFDVLVSWARGKYLVQVGIVTSDGRPLAEALGTWQDEDGTIHMSVPNEYIQDEGVWGTFEVDDIDRMIRVLRRAREQVSTGQEKA